MNENPRHTQIHDSKSTKHTHREKERQLKHTSSSLKQKRDSSFGEDVFSSEILLSDKEIQCIQIHTFNML